MFYKKTRNDVTSLSNNNAVYRQMKIDSGKHYVMSHLHRSLQCNCEYFLANLNVVQPLVQLQLIISRQDSEIGSMVFKIGC